MHAFRTAYNAHRIHHHLAATQVATAFRHRCCCTSTATAVYIAPTEAHLQYLASSLAQERNAGDCYCLYGSVGAGKSVFSRAFIRAAAEDPSLPVPSPTYLLQLIYDEQNGPAIYHYDLYRLHGQQDMCRLDVASSFKTAVNLVEWSERLPEQLLPEQRLEVHIDILPEQQLQRSSGSADAVQQQHSSDLRGLLQQQGDATDSHVQGDMVLGTPGIDNLQWPIDESNTTQSWDTGEEELSGTEAEYEEALYTDERARRVVLKAVGQAWVARLKQLAAQLQ